MRAAVAGGLTGVGCLGFASAALAAPIFTPVPGSPFARSTGANEVLEPYGGLVAFSPDGGLLASSSEVNGTVSMFSVSSGGALAPVGSPYSIGDSTVGVAFSPDGSLLAVTSGGADGLVTVFSVAPGGMLTPVGAPSPVGSNPSTVEFSPGGGLLATADNDSNDVAVFSVAPGGVLTPVAGSPFGTGASPYGLSFSHDGGLLATADSDDSTISVFSVALDGVLTQVADSPVSDPGDPIGLAFSPAGMLATGSFYGSTTVFSVSSSGALTPTPGSPYATGEFTFGVTFSPDGALLAASNLLSGTVSMFSVAAPTAQISTPSDQQTYSVKESVPTSFSCTDSTGAPGISSCTDSHGGSGTSGSLNTSSAGVQSYTVTATSQDGQTATATIHYAVTAAPATVPSVPTVPVVHGCSSAAGRLGGGTLGRIALGMTRQQATSEYPQNSTHGKRFEQFFCVSVNQIRVGYASHKLQRTLTPNERTRVRGRVVLALTANPFYAIRGVRPGTSLDAAAKTLHTGKVMHVGLNDWYMAFNGSSTVVIKVRSGIVQEIGIATKMVTHGRKAQNTFIRSFS